MSEGAGDDSRRLAEQDGLEGIDRIVPFDVPLATRFRGVTRRIGLLLHGSAGWGEWSPFDEYPDEVAAVWLNAALDAARVPGPTPVRDRVPVNVTIPAVGPDTARRLVATSGCATAKVKVAEPDGTLDDDVARVRAVRDELGAGGRIRIDANAAWTRAQATDAVRRLAEAAGGLEYVEQPCDTLDDLAAVRAATGVRVAADEAIRRDHADPALVRDAVDVAIIKVQPSGGVTAALALVERLGLPAVVSSALETSVGLAAGLRLAAALPELPFACGLGTGLLLAEDVVERPLLPAARLLDVRAATDLTVLGAVPSPASEAVEALHARLARVTAGGGVSG